MGDENDCEPAKSRSQEHDDRGKGGGYERILGVMMRMGESTKDEVS